MVARWHWHAPAANPRCGPQSPAKFKAKIGKHVLTVTAVNEAGKTDPLPGKHRFAVVAK